ncbi:hypothetical protein [Pseudogracilibacillus sp. SO30301A]|uniref:hypothetical protein n=1 Tax=Pseudogracilibacillus sp. SO30301A TaxID=3098291 RepID=UPI00300DF7D2
MWGPEFSLEVLKETLLRLGISSKYYNLNGNMKNHSIILERINDTESKVKLIGKEGEVLGETMKLENGEAYNAMYHDLYKFYLLNQYCQKLIATNEIDQPFTDDDYKMFLFPSSYGN